MKVKVTLICLFICIAFILVAFMGCFIPVRMTSALKVDTGKIDKIVVGADWGQSKTITSKDEIQAILSYLDGYTCHRNILLPTYSGYIYNMSFYSGDSQIASLIIGIYPIINNKKYETTTKMSIEEIENIVGLYPPR